MTRFYILLSFLFTELLISQNVQWVRSLKLGRPNDKDETISGITVDSSGNVYLIGNALVAYGGYWTNKKFSSFNIISPEGDFIYRDTLAMQINYIQRYKGSIYTLGANTTNNRENLMKRSPDGTILSVIDLPWKDGAYHIGYSGNFYNHHLYSPYPRNDLMKFDLEGNQIFRVPIAPNPLKSSVVNVHFCMSQENLYLNSVFYGEGEGGYIQKYDTLGNLIWKLGSPSVNQMKADDGGNIYLAYWEHIVKVNAQGDQVWIAKVDSVNFRDMAVSGDTLYACGRAPYEAGCVLVKISVSDAKIISKQTFDFNPGSCIGQEFTNICVKDNDIYLGGAYCNQLTKFFLVKIGSDKPNGNVISQTLTASTFVIFPNPTGGAFTISGKSSGSVVKVEVRNVLGKTVHFQQLQTFSGEFSELIDPGTLPKGVYLVEISSGEARQTSKIVVE